MPPLIRKILISSIVLASALSYAPGVHAAFILSSAILEFTNGSPLYQDVEIISRSEAEDYLVTKVKKIDRPGTPEERVTMIDDPDESGLLVTPDKTILPGGGRKILRFLLLKEPDEQEHIYRVAVKPVIKGLQADVQAGLKILVGYEVLVIVRPLSPAPSFSAKREGKELVVTNTGNVGLLFQQGNQCDTTGVCEIARGARAYPASTLRLELPKDAPVTYSIWDGKETTERHFE